MLHIIRLRLSLFSIQFFLTPSLLTMVGRISIIWRLVSTRHLRQIPILLKDSSLFLSYLCSIRKQLIFPFCCLLLIRDCLYSLIVQVHEHRLDFLEALPGLVSSRRFELSLLMHFAKLLFLGPGVHSRLRSKKWVMRCHSL